MGECKIRITVFLGAENLPRYDLPQNEEDRNVHGVISDISVFCP